MNKNFILFCLSIFIAAASELRAEDLTSVSENNLNSFSISAAREILGTFNGDFVGTSSVSIGYSANEVWDFYLTRLIATNYLFKTDRHIELEGVAVGTRYFLSRRFYLKGGLSQQKILNSGGHWKVRMTLIVADAAIGNQWTLGNFIIGADWIGMSSQAITSKIDEDVPSPTNGSSNDETKSKMKNTGRLRGPNFYLGYSF